MHHISRFSQGFQAFEESPCLFRGKTVRFQWTPLRNFEKNTFEKKWLSFKLQRLETRATGYKASESAFKCGRRRLPLRRSACSSLTNASKKFPTLPKERDWWSFKVQSLETNANVLSLLTSLWSGCCECLPFARNGCAFLMKAPKLGTRSTERDYLSKDGL